MGLKEYYDTIDPAYYQILVEQHGQNLQPFFQGLIGEPAGLRILDVGCGTGTKFSFLMPHNEVYGLDISQRAVAKAKERGIRALLHDVEQPFPFGDGEFDMALCTEVLEHLVQPRKTLREIYRVLRPGGVLWVGVPNNFCLWERVSILFGGNVTRFGATVGHDEWDMEHLRFFTRKGFLRGARQEGFELVQDCSIIHCQYLKTLVMAAGGMREPALPWWKRDKPYVAPYLALARAVGTISRRTGLDRLVRRLYPAALFSVGFVFKFQKGLGR